ncbi:MAG: class I SAM-dependent methyltransferase [Magnetococcales bacterium]|nr:class I SAM-dependent methyltransferase [Magnetococcales bacterium]
MASNDGFKKVIGVEASASMCDISLENLKKYGKHFLVTVPFEVVNMDARDYPIEDSVNVFYFLIRSRERYSKAL